MKIGLIGQRGRIGLICSMFYVLCSMFFGGAAKVRAEGLRYLHTDHLGSVAAVSDEKGEKVDERRYLPFGDQGNQGYQGYRGDQGNQGRRGFTGQERDDETNLYNYNARLYNPRLGQFISADKAGGGGNGYAYVRSNPLRFTDPSGNQPVFDPGGGGGGGDKSGLELEISGGSVLNRQAEISSSQPADPVQVYIPQEVDARSFWLLMANTVGASFAAPIIVVAGPGGVITGIFITADLRAVAADFTNPQTQARTRALSLGRLGWDLIPILGSLRHGLAAGRAARALTEGASSADEIAERALAAGVVDRVVSTPSYPTGAEGYFRLIEGGVREMYLGAKATRVNAAHELTHAIQHQMGVLQLTERAEQVAPTLGNKVFSLMRSFYYYVGKPSTRIAEWEANVFFGGTNYLLLPLSTPFGWNETAERSSELLRGK